MIPSAAVALQAAVALPVLAAAVLAGAGRWLPRPAVDATALAAAAAVTALTALTLARSGRGPQVAWLGGWGPGTGVGIPLAADPLAAGLACVTAALTLAALAFSWLPNDFVKPLRACSRCCRGVGCAGWRAGR
ncbi:hypothetical protein [Actinomadura geliboluensis]|uniref:hypothetical protein n=1 Tax=Actinomadura geliboluensis TaxID=882440 RepID=UPI00371D74AC